jgi:hypothetical protein
MPLFTEMNLNTRIVRKYNTQFKKILNRYVIVQVVLSKFTAEIQNANSINKTVDFSLHMVYLVVNDGSK